MATVTFKVDGETVELDIEAELTIIDPHEERHRVAAQIAYWGVIAAAAEAEVDRLEAERDTWFNSGLATCLKRDEKIAEWKAKAMVNAHENHLAMLKGIANAKAIANKAKSVHAAFTRKSDMLRSMINLEGGGVYRSGDVGRVDTQNDPRFDKFKNKRRATAQEG